MAFHDSSREHVRTVAHPSILILLVMDRASVQRLVIAYTVDLIRVLRELFDITLRPDLALTISWAELQAAFEAYERSHSRQRIHKRICSEMTLDNTLSAEDISQKVRELLRD